MPLTNALMDFMLLTNRSLAYVKNLVYFIVGDRMCSISDRHIWNVMVSVFQVYH